MLRFVKNYQRGYAEILLKTINEDIRRLSPTAEILLKTINEDIRRLSPTAEILIKTINEDIRRLSPTAEIIHPAKFSLSKLPKP